MSQPATYEGLRARIAALLRPNTSDEREVYWATDARKVGVSRTHEDRLEIFLAGPPIVSKNPSINAALEHGPWWHRGVSTPAFEANRLLLPPNGRFDEIAAFVCTELLQNGADDDLGMAFESVESIVGLIFERLRLSDEALLGLAGELLVLDSLCQRIHESGVAAIVQAWDGWRPSLRDISWGTLGVEIKTTQRSASTHRIQGIHQIERYDSDGTGGQETGLLLVSVGLARAPMHSNSFSVPQLVERILQRLRATGRDDASQLFLDRLREYGSGSGFGYDHRTMSSDVAFSGAFETSFVRSYDMTDENIAVLRRSDVTHHLHVDSNSLSYVIDLPLRASGDLNPIVGLNQSAEAILSYARATSLGSTENSYEE